MDKKQKTSTPAPTQAERSRILLCKQEPIEILHGKHTSKAKWPEWDEGLLPDSWVKKLNAPDNSMRDEVQAGGMFRPPLSDHGRDLEDMLAMIEFSKEAAGKEFEIVKLYDGIFIVNTNPFPVKFDNGITLRPVCKEIAVMFRIHNLRLSYGSNQGPIRFHQRARNYDFSMMLPVSIIRAAMDAVITAAPSAKEAEWPRIMPEYFGGRMPNKGNPPHRLLITISAVAAEALGFVPPQDTSLVSFIDTDDSHGLPAEQKKVCSNKFISF